MAPVKKRFCAPPVFPYRNAALNRYSHAAPFTSKFLRCLFDVAGWRPVDDPGEACALELSPIDANKPISNDNVCLRKNSTPRGRRWSKPGQLAQVHVSRAAQILARAKLAHDARYAAAPAPVKLV